MFKSKLDQNRKLIKKNTGNTKMQAKKSMK